MKAFSSTRAFFTFIALFLQAIEKIEYLYVLFFVVLLVWYDVANSFYFMLLWNAFLLRE